MREVHIIDKYDSNSLLSFLSDIRSESETEYNLIVEKLHQKILNYNS